MALFPYFHYPGEKFGNKQLSVAKQVEEAIREYVEQANETQKKQFVIAIRAQIGLDELLPQLVTVAREMNLTVEELVDAHVGTYSYSASGFLEYTTEQFQDLLTVAEGVIDNRYKLAKLLRCLTNEVTWPSEPKVLKQAQQLLEMILEHWPIFSDALLADLTVIFFLKLLAYNAQIQQTAQRLFRTLSQTELVELRPWPIREVIGGFFSKSLSVLKSFLTHDDEAVRVGSALLLQAITGTIDRYVRVGGEELEEIRNIRLEPEMGKSFLEHEDSKRRLVGIALLTWSDYPVEDVKYRNQLLVALQHAKTAKEERAWAQLLQKIPISEEQQLRWSNLLEEILAEPRNYGSLVLSAAMGRYQKPIMLPMLQYLRSRKRNWDCPKVLCLQAGGATKRL